MAIDLVLATAGRTAELGRFLGSLSSQDELVGRVIVVDQNPDDRLIPIMAPHLDHLRITHLRSERGLSLARNVGLEIATAPIVAFPDDDCWYPPGLLAKVACELRGHPEWSGLTGVARDADGRPSGGRFDATAGLLTRRNVWTRAVSISIFLRRAVVEEVGGFDETLGLGARAPWRSGEETDLLLRVLHAGHEIHFDPALVVGHPQTRRSFGPADLEAARGFGLGMGRVMGLHAAPAHEIAYHVTRAIAGAGLAAARGRVSEARFHLGVGAGRLQGWRSARSRPR